MKKEVREKKALEKKLQELENEALLKQKQYKEKFGVAGAGGSASVAELPQANADQSKQGGLKPKQKALTKRGASNPPPSLLNPAHDKMPSSNG